MRRRFYQCTLVGLMLCAWALAQTPTQTPQHNYPNENQPSAPQSVQQPQQPATPNPQAYPEENPQTPTAMSTPQSNQPRTVNSDDALKNQLQRTLAINPRLSDVQPVVNRGQVTLTGTVPTDADRADAKRMVEEVSGVNKVVDEMAIGTTSHQPPGGNAAQSSGTPLPQSDVYGKGSSAQGAAQRCECKKGTNDGTYPGSDEPCACSGTTTHSGQSQPKNNPRPVPPKSR